MLIFRALVGAEAAVDRATAFLRTSPALRSPRAAWRHGYAVLAVLGGLTLGAVELARGYGLGAIVGALLGAALVYGGLRLVGALYDRGILRGGR